MSYNISTWKTKELKDFRIAVEALKPIAGYLSEPTIDLVTNVLTFSGRAEGFELIGKRDGGYLLVERIENWGEASGTMQGFLGEQVFPHSTGSLIATCVWEHGDSITRFIVQDGVVAEEDIEL